MEKFTLQSFLLRLLAAFALVFLTFNPSGYSYIHWVAHEFPKISALQAVVGVLLVAGWIVFVVATLRSIGVLGVILVVVFFAALTWLMISMGWFALNSAKAIGWITLTALSVALAVGVSWSFVNRRLTGQVDVDETDNR